MDEVVAWLDESIRFVSDRPVILMAHDWGAVFAYVMCALILSAWRLIGLILAIRRRRLRAVYRSSTS